jgi:hypothetical protein
VTTDDSDNKHPKNKWTKQTNEIDNKESKRSVLLFESYYKILFFILMNKQTNKVKGKALIR